MSAYVATGRISRVAPHWAMDASYQRERQARPEIADTDLAAVGLTPVVDADPLLDRLAAVRDRWSQLTFFLFDVESWR